MFELESMQYFLSGLPTGSNSSSLLELLLCLSVVGDGIHRVEVVLFLFAVSSQGCISVLV